MIANHHSHHANQDTSTSSSALQDQGKVSETENESECAKMTPPPVLTLTNLLEDIQSSICALCQLRAQDAVHINSLKYKIGLYKAAWLQERIKEAEVLSQLDAAERAFEEGQLFLHNTSSDIDNFND